MSDKKPIEPGLIARLTGAFKALTGEGVVIDNGTQWFGPLNPPVPTVSPQQQEGVIGRQFDYPVGINMRYQPRSGEAVSFAQMRALADSCDVLRLVIETRKDQMAKMKFGVKPIDEKKKADSRCQEVEEFLRLPDGENDWNSWLRQLLEEMLVIDGATIYPWMLNGGKPYRFELMDGATIKRVLDVRGRTPAPPQPAYQQILKGLPVADYTLDELVYAPRNKRVHKIYGYSPVEQVIMTVNIAIRRALHQLQYYTEGSTPDLLFQVPADWNMTQIKEFNDWWQDTLAGNTSARRKAQFVPNGVAPVNTKELILKDPMDEWLARIICYAFSVSAQPFIKENNRSTAETAAKAALEEGLTPIMLWVKGIMDLLIWKYFGYRDLEFSWSEEEAVDSDTQSQIDDRNLKNGSVTIDEVRARRGDAPYGEEWSRTAMVLTASGYMPVERALEPPAPPPMFAGMVAPTEDGKGPQPAPSKGKQGESQPAPAEKPEGEEDPEPEPDGTGGGTTKIAKASKVKPINRDPKARAKVEKAIAEGLTKVFKAQAKALANHVVNKVAKAQDDPIDVDALQFEGWDTIQDLFGTQLATAAELGVTDAYVQLDLDNPDMLDVANEGGIAFAEQRAAELVGKRILDDGSIIDNPNSNYSIEEATREMIRGDVTTAMEQGLSNDELASMLEENYAFSEERALTIARTETAFADCQGNLVLYRESGVVTSKQWIVGDGCCDECAEVNGEIVGLDEKFSNDVEAPPAHPNCRCDFIPVLSEQSEEESE